MAKIIITMDIPSEYADPDHKMGVTEEGYNAIADALIEVGGTDIDVRPAAEAGV